ncbi:MAG: energy transducer TonB, partial [Candidatus Dadabacteria bacterium]
MVFGELDTKGDVSMEARKILESDLLDILFESRNKEYGAYALRKNYNRRIAFATLFTLVLIAVIVSTTFLMRKKEKEIGELQVRDVVVQNIEQKPPPPPPPPPEKQKETPPPAEKAAPVKAPPIPHVVETTKFTPPVIKKDNEVVQQEVPKVEEVQKVDIATTVGPKDEGIVNTAPKVELPPVDKGTGVVGSLKSEDQHAAKEDENKIFEKVEIEASVNAAQWRTYLQNQLQRYIEDAASNGMSPGKYTVQVRFLVDKDGSISDAQALNDPGYGLGKGAVEVLKRGPKWTPGEQNGKKV